MKRPVFYLILGLLFPLVGLPQSSNQENGTKQRENVGLFFDQNNIPEFRHRLSSDPMFAQLKARLEGIDREAERKFLESEVRFNDHLYHIKRVSDTAQRMAFLYLFSGDRDAADLAIQCTRTLMRFPNWDYFLDGGETLIGLQRAPGATLAVSICVELLGDLVSKEEREQWLRTMGERGNEPSFRSIHGMRYPEKVKGWGIDPQSTYFEHRPGDRGWDLSRWPIILNTINLKAVPASALAIGALAYRKYLGEDQNTRRWLEQAVFSIKTFRDIFEKDGSYSEGVSYAQYTTLHLVQAIIALKKQLGLDLTDLLNWPGYSTYLQEMTMPTNDNPAEIVNFSDAGGGATSAVPFWIAGHSYDMRALWFGQTLARQHDEWSLLWYDPEIPAEPPRTNTGLWQSNLDWIVGRSGYAPADLVVAMRSGGPHNHEHADRNSIIVKCFGEQLVTDPHRPPYSFSDPSWMMRTTAGHSAVLIDGKGHQYVDGSEGTNASLAVATIVRSGLRNGFLFWTSDATPAYRLEMPDVASITRTVVVLSNVPAVLLFDKVRKTSQPSRIQARFFGYNNDGNGKMSADGNTFSIIRPAAQLTGFCYGNSNLSITTSRLPIPEEKAMMYPFVEASTKKAQMESFLISVLLPSRISAEHASANIQLQKAGQYTIEIHSGGRETVCQVFDTGSIPEFQIK
jgi:hypothetical protein